MARNLHRQVRHQTSVGGSAGEQDGSAPKRPSLYAEVTQRIIRELEEGRLPWVQPWDRAKADTGLPRNAASHRPYSGINVLILWGAVIEHGYGSQGWLTYRQARELGGHVREGEHGVTVCYADRFCPQAEQERADRDGDAARLVAFLKRFTVFNIDQCEDLPESVLASPVPLPEREIVPVAEEIIANTGADFRIGGDKAFFHPGSDFVQVPPQPAFHNQIDWYRTAFHELGHWVGHKSRLDRDQSGRFGSVQYAKEELVAEIASAFVCAQLNIQPSVRHADYVGAWLEVMKGDERAIFRAAAQAARASQWILDQCRNRDRERQQRTGSRGGRDPASPQTGVPRAPRRATEGFRPQPVSGPKQAPRVPD